MDEEKVKEYLKREDFMPVNDDDYDMIEVLIKRIQEVSNLFSKYRLPRINKPDKDKKAYEKLSDRLFYSSMKRTIQKQLKLELKELYTDYKNGNMVFLYKIKEEGYRVSHKRPKKPKTILNRIERGKNELGGLLYEKTEFEVVVINDNWFLFVVDDIFKDYK